MLNKFTIIGIVAGCIISGIGGASLVDNISSPVEKMEFDDIFLSGEKTTFTFVAPKDSKQHLDISGDSWDVRVQTPNDMKVPQIVGKDTTTLSWTAISEGENKIFIENNSNSELKISGTLEKSRDPLFFTYHILVIIAGVVVIGFSAGFSAKKPKGF